MKLLRIRKPGSGHESGGPAANLLPPEHALPYEPPRVSDLGRVRDVVLGSSSSGNADSNSQYYW